MHPNPSFHKTEKQISLDFVRKRAFGSLVISANPVPLISHIPFLLAEDGSSALLHLVRSNPITRLKEPSPAKILVTGADAYISPDWYGEDDHVPTWNYVAVHLTGVLEPLPAEDLPDVLAAQSDDYETRLLPKPVWKMDKLSDEVQARFWRMILPYRFRVEDIDSTWKLGQNKNDTVRRTAADQVETGIGSELAEPAALMANPPQTS